MSSPIASAPPPGQDRPADVLLTAFPRGRLSEIVGPWSSGGSSLLLALLSRVTATGALAALVDEDDALDPVSAREAGVDLRHLLWVRCGGRPGLALRAADLLARCPGFPVVAVDLGTRPTPRILHPSLVRLQRAVESGGGALVLRTSRHVTGSVAGLVLSVSAAHVSWAGTPTPTCLGGLLSAVEVAVTRGHCQPGAWSPSLAPSPGVPDRGQRFHFFFSPGSSPVGPGTLPNEKGAA